MRPVSRIKADALLCLYRNYWPYVGVYALFYAITIALSGVILQMAVSFSLAGEAAWLSSDEYAMLYYRTLFASGQWVFILLTLLVGTVVTVCTARFAISVTCCERVHMGKAFSPFKNYGRSLGGMLWMNLWVFLWSLLFIVPGIVKAYAYFMTPYLLAEFPAVRAMDALELSKKMTYGFKGRIFLTHLSFIGWILLCPLTLGVLWFLYVGPYYITTMAGVYQEIKSAALARGVVTREELGIA